MKKSFSFISVAALLISATAWADANIELSTDQQTVMVQVKDHRVRLLAADPESQTQGEAIFDELSNSLVVVDHANRSIFELDAQTIEKIGGTLEAAAGAVQQQLQNMPSEQRDRMQDLIRGFGLEIPEESPPELRLSSPIERQYQQIKCQEHRVLEGERAIATVCITQGNSLNISDQDYLSLLAAQRFMLNAASQTSHLAEQYGQKIPDFGGIQLNGVLVHSVQAEPYDKDSEQAVTASFSINKISTEELAPIAPPADYQKKNLPF